ncbi:MAG: hypothetical protein HC794_10470 [Nitrospiraceae bacterium]|nr:hypothetical protein [Nitrospiraceae bacterium]
MSDVVKIVSVDGRLLDPGYGYVRVRAFQERTAQDLAAKLVELMEDAAKAVISAGMFMPEQQEHLRGLAEDRGIAAHRAISQSERRRAVRRSPLASTRCTCSAGLSRRTSARSSPRSKSAARSRSS